MDLLDVFAYIAMMSFHDLWIHHSEMQNNQISTKGRKNILILKKDTSEYYQNLRVASSTCPIWSHAFLSRVHMEQ